MVISRELDAVLRGTAVFFFLHKGLQHADTCFSYVCKEQSAESAETKPDQAEPPPHELLYLEYNRLSGAAEHLITESSGAFRSQSER